MSWTPQPNVEKDWTPIVPEDESVAPSVRDAWVVLPYIPERPAGNTDPYYVVDLKPNIGGGREPYEFLLDSIVALPSGTILEHNGRLLLPWTANLDENYQATVRVRDANNASVTFVFATQAAAGPLVIHCAQLDHGELPDAHTDAAFFAQFTATGGVPPITFVFSGLDLANNGFTFDGTTGVLAGGYNGNLGTSLANVWQVQAYNAGSPIGGPFDADLGGVWDWIDP